MASTTTRVLTALQRGQQLTKQQVTEQFGVRNVSATMSRLRQNGFPVYSNRKTVNGTTTNVYRLGSARRREIRAGRYALKHLATFLPTYLLK
jgi:hypothetical protein